MKPLFFLFLLALTGWAITPEEVINIKERAENGEAEAQHYLGDGVTKTTLEPQQHFASIVEMIEAQKSLIRKQHDKFDTLFASLQSLAFRGEL